jgi:transglutaminase-like putative cysteine protease
MSNNPYALMKIPDGVEGIRTTLKIMSAIVTKYKASKFARELVIKILKDAGVPQYTPSGKKNWVGQIRAIHNYVKNDIRYIKDVDGVETVQTPPQTYRLGHGDCDDKSVLAATLLKAIGHPARFKAVGFAPGIYCHVYPQTKIAGKWITMECTEPWPLGKSPKNIKAEIIEDIK